MKKQDRQIVEDVIFPVDDGKEEDLILNLIRIVRHLDKQHTAMLALLERWVKQFPEPDMGRATYDSWKQQDVIDDTKTLLKEAKEVKDETN